LERILIKLQGNGPGIIVIKYGNDLLIHGGGSLDIGNGFTPAVIILY
jgi:hypothetical protein